MLALLLMNRMSSVRRRYSKQNKCIIESNYDKKRSQEFCRTCLSTHDLVSLFYNKETEKRRSEDLKLVTGLQIKMNDELSQKICIRCVEAVNNALTFRSSSRKAEKALLMMKSKTKKKVTKVKKKIGKKSIKKTAKIELDIDDNDVKDYNNDDFNDDDYNNDDCVNDDFNDGVGDEIQIESYEDSKPTFPEVAQKERKGRQPRYVYIPNASSYKCNLCEKEFRMKSTYKAHLRFHTNYCVCESCGKRCRNNNQLQEHKRARHGLGRIHKCAYCEYSSATKEALTIHERRHTGERPYVCDHCGATFHRRSNLVQHIAIHLPEKNFQCDMCPKRLKSKKFLQIHKHNAHTGRRYGYLCAVCDHRFEKPNKVRAHTRRVHGLPDDQQPPIVRVQL